MSFTHASLTPLMLTPLRAHIIAHKDPWRLEVLELLIISASSPLLLLLILLYPQHYCFVLLPTVFPNPISPPPFFFPNPKSRHQATSVLHRSTSGLPPVLHPVPVPENQGFVYSRIANKFVFKLYSSCCPSLYLSIRTRVGGLGRYFHKRMGKGNKEGTSKQFRWTKPMEHVFLEILAEEARKGNKPSNTFKSVSINRVADAISSRFQVQCDTKHVENHLRTVKNQWQIICKIRGESGFGWDDNMKMITCDRATYDATVMTATMKRLKR
ncbi:uncharacterized protein [Gossypium hirsutum]|uniref:Myb/SANT-like domain-containing protein n=1 Tax=Gossypium hirsutum TaxID=3635 RepID=A0ABM3AFP0_GOSHI|nr:uncharacterized protein LOC121219468 [Gossypium hirsutum]